MNLNTSVSTKDRKPLVSALVELLAQPPSYDGPPSYAYRVGDYIVDRHGNVIVPDEASDETIRWLRDKLTEKGFEIDPDPETPQANHDAGDTADSAEEADSEEGIKSEEELPADTAASDECSDEETLSDPDEPAEDESDEATSNEETEQDEPVSDSEPGDASDHETSETPDDGKTHITLSLPRFQFTFSAIERLKAIVQSKQTLLKKALDTDTLEIQLTDDKVLFPWFTDHGLTGEADAYTKLVFAIAKLAVNQKRASAEEKQNDNEKLAMRLFLIRLGFIGDEYKTARAILTRNFTGNSAWKSSPNGKDSASELSLPEVFISNAHKEDPNA